MTSLKLHGNDVKCVFQLLGSKENDITFSMAWALSCCPAFLDSFVYRVSGIHPNSDLTTILIQDYKQDIKKETQQRGFTDIEITDTVSFHIIVEAKRGWVMPGKGQLNHYAHHLNPQVYRHLVTLSECSVDYAMSILPDKEIAGVPLSHVSWSEIYNMVQASISKSTNKQKDILKGFKIYLEGVITMQKQDSNWVIVFPLNHNHPDGCELSNIEIVNKKRKYFCKVGSHGLKTPPNYIAFRYDGKLQTIHHIEGYTISKNMHTEIPEMPDVEWADDHFVFQLGDEIRPPKEVKTGNVYASGRKWAMLDTLLTSDTISDASKISYERIHEQEE